MKTADRICAWAMLALGCIHMSVAISLMAHDLTSATAWFYSGGLALIFGAFLNLNRAHRPQDMRAAVTSLIANLLLLTLAAIFGWLLRNRLKDNPQEIVFAVLLIAELWFSVARWPHVKKTME